MCIFDKRKEINVDIRINRKDKNLKRKVQVEEIVRAWLFREACMMCPTQGSSAKATALLSMPTHFKGFVYLQLPSHFFFLLEFDFSSYLILIFIFYLSLIILIFFFIK